LNIFSGCMCCIVLQEQLKQIQESKSKHFPRRSPATWVIISPAQAATADDKNPANERNLVRAQSVAARTLRKCTQMPRKTSIQRRRSRSVHNLAPNGNRAFSSCEIYFGKMQSHHQHIKFGSAEATFGKAISNNPEVGNVAQWRPKREVFLSLLYAPFLSVRFSFQAKAHGVIITDKQPISMLGKLEHWKEAFRSLDPEQVFVAPKTSGTPANQNQGR